MHFAGILLNTIWRLCLALQAAAENSETLMVTLLVSVLLLIPNGEVSSSLCAPGWI